jgi:predicted signal transduction protein with EAL and GGDEF domain
MDQDSDAAAMVRTMVALAQNLDLEVVAEGVTTQDQVRVLRALGCEMAQGELYGLAAPAAHFAAQQPQPQKRLAAPKEVERENAVTEEMLFEASEPAVPATQPERALESVA